MVTWDWMGRVLPFNLRKRKRLIRHDVLYDAFDGRYELLFPQGRCWCLWDPQTKHLTPARVNQRRRPIRTQNGLMTSSLTCRTGRRTTRKAKTGPRRASAWAATEVRGQRSWCSACDPCRETRGYRSTVDLWYFQSSIRWQKLIFLIQNQQLADDLNEFYCRFEKTPQTRSGHLST